MVWGCKATRDQTLTYNFRSAVQRNLLTRILDYVKWQFHKVALDRAFDRRRNVDTGGQIPAFILRSGREGVRYQAVEPDSFMKAVGSLDIDVAEFRFVDIGCGKGRALLLARDLGFKNIIGVEISQSLCEIARRNCPDAEILCANAASYLLPEGPCVVYFFNPFGESLIRTLGANILKHRGPCVVVYVNPLHRGIFDADSRFKLLRGNKDVGIWEVAAD